MNLSRWISRATLAALTLAVVASPASAAAGRYVGSVINDDPRLGRQIERLVIDVERLSTPEELVALASAPDKVASVGSARLDRTLGQDLIAAIEVSEGGKKKLVLVFDGPFRWFDARKTPSAKKFPNGVVELELGADGRGQGTLVVGAQVKFGNGVTVESASGEPLRVIQVSTGD